MTWPQAMLERIMRFLGDFGKATPERKMMIALLSYFMQLLVKLNTLSRARRGL